MSSSISSEEFLYFQSQSLDYLYDVMPVANDSLFIADFDGVANARFRVKKITVPTPEIEFSTNEQLKMSFPTKVTSKDDLTIEWYEDAFDSVRKYHLNMMNNMVMLNSGIFRRGAAPLTSISINKFAYAEGNSAAETPFDSIPMPILTGTMVLSGIAVKSVGDIEFDSSAGGDIKTVTVNYKVGRISYTGPVSMRSQVSANDFSGITSSGIELL